MPLNFGPDGLPRGDMIEESSDVDNPFGSLLFGESPPAGKASGKPESSPAASDEYGEFENDVFGSAPARTTRVPLPSRPAVGKLPAASLKTPPPVTPLVVPKTTGKSVLTTRVVLYSDGDLLRKTVCW